MAVLERLERLRPPVGARTRRRGVRDAVGIGTLLASPPSLLLGHRLHHNHHHHLQPLLLLLLPRPQLLEELRSSTLLSNWGGVTGLSGQVEERCFAPGRDVSLPGTLKESVVLKAPWLLDEAARRRQLASRTTQLFFFGALCWKTETKARPLAHVSVSTSASPSPSPSPSSSTLPP